MPAQPKRAPEPEPETPRLRSRTRPRLSTSEDRPAGVEVSRLQDRVNAAFTPPAAPRGRTTDLLLKVLTVAAACICVGAALARNAPMLGRILG